MPLTFDLPIEELKVYRGKNPHIQFLAPRIQAEVLWGIGLMDTICPPSTQFAVYNKLTSSKEMAIYPDFGHETIPGWNDQAFQFLMGV